MEYLQYEYTGRTLSSSGFDGSSAFELARPKPASGDGKANPVFVFLALCFVGGALEAVQIGRIQARRSMGAT